MIGRRVEIRSRAGTVYRGVVRSIRDGGTLGEIIELGSAEDPEYQRLVFVTDRTTQVAESDLPP
jgi:hypothetical protein